MSDDVRQLLLSPGALSGAPPYDGSHTEEEATAVASEAGTDTQQGALRASNKNWMVTSIGEEIMPLGKQTGTFSSNSTSTRVTAVDGDRRTVEGTFEGEVTGELAGQLMRTIIFEGENDYGTYTGCGASFRANGEAIHGEERGAYTRTGPGVWATRGVVSLSTGQTMIIEGEVALENRTWGGKIFEVK